MFSDKKEDCPFWRGPCREHKCRLYIQLIGRNPNTDEQINRWGCSFEFLPMLLVENTQQARENGAAVESFRNEVLAGNAQTRNQLVNMSFDELQKINPKLIGN